MTPESTNSLFNESLEELDFLVLEKLHPINLTQLTIEEIRRYKTTCHPLQEIIRKRLFKEILYQSQERGIENFIHLLQAHLVYLSDTLTSYQDQVSLLNDEILKEYRSLLELAASMLIGNISHLHTQFSEYFNEDGKVPLAIIAKTKSFFSQELNTLRTYSDNLKSKLLTVALAPLEEFQLFVQHPGEEDPKKFITFRQINYLKILMKELLNALKSREGIEEILKDTLIYINFNTYFFFQFVVCEIEQKTRQEKDSHVKRYKLLYYQKKFRQIEEKRGISLKPERRSIKDQLTGWVSEELSLLGNYMEDEKAILPAKEPEDFKIESRLPVEQLSYFLHLCMEVGIIANKNRKDVMRFFSLNTQSLLKETISAKSLRNKSYNPEQRTRTAIKSLVIFMLNLITQG